MSNKVNKRIILTSTAIMLVLVAVVGSGLSVKSGHLHQDVQAAAKLRATSVINADAIPQTAHAESVRTIVHVTNLGTSGNLWLALWRIPSLLIAFAIVFLIVEITLSIANGDALTASNVIKLRVLGGILILTTFIKLLTDYARQQLIGYSSLNNFDLLPISVSYAPALAGLAVFLVAEAFIAGKKAVDSADGLI